MENRAIEKKSEIAVYCSIFYFRIFNIANFKF